MRRECDFKVYRTRILTATDVCEQDPQYPEISAILVDFAFLQYLIYFD